VVSGGGTGDALFESIFDTAAIGMALVDPDGRVIRCNEALQSILGHGEAALQGRSFAEFTHPDDAANDAGRLAELLAGTRHSYQRATRYVHRNGHVVHAQVTASRSSTGLVVVIITDVTAEWEARDQLRRSRERLGLTLSAIDMGFWEWDVSTDHMVWSEEMARLCGLGAAPVVDGRYGERFYLIHPGDRGMVTRTVHEALANPEQGVIACEFRVVRPNRHERWVVAKAHIFRDVSGQPLRVVGALMDVTPMRILREEFLQAQKMESVGRFVSGIAHDFNNALMVIGGQCDVLGMTALTPEKMRRGLAEISDAVDRAANLTQQLLTFGRKGQADPQVLDPNAILQRLETFIKPLVGAHDLRLALAAQAGWITVDERQLEQAVVNLVINARDAMPETGVITISTGNIADGRVFIAVRDSGVGMDEATRSRLFEPFFTTKAPGHGTGLGLAVVLAVMEGAGGDIHVETAPGAGSTFELRFPQAR
jgi:two-component system cell cycle sensor histidine kinase/response regulator CckA